MDNFGMRVMARHAAFGRMEFHNVTEVHYKYPSLDKNRVAFESNIHGTGATYSTHNILEMEIVPETELAPEF